MQKIKNLTKYWRNVAIIFTSSELSTTSNLSNSFSVKQVYLKLKTTVLYSSYIVKWNFIWIRHW